jgi:hypothetical protein
MLRGFGADQDFKQPNMAVNVSAQGRQSVTPKHAHASSKFFLVYFRKWRSYITLESVSFHL